MEDDVTPTMTSTRAARVAAPVATHPISRRAMQKCGIEEPQNPANSPQLWMPKNM